MRDLIRTLTSFSHKFVCLSSNPETNQMPINIFGCYFLARSRVRAKLPARCCSERWRANCFFNSLPSPHPSPHSLILTPSLSPSYQLFSLSLHSAPITPKSQSYLRLPTTTSIVLIQCYSIYCYSLLHCPSLELLPSLTPTFTNITRGTT